MESLIQEARKCYHKNLLEDVLTIDKDGKPSNSDKDNPLSVSAALNIYEQIKLKTNVSESLSGQTKGKKFEEFNAEFINATFPKLNHIRPGKWSVERHKNITSFDQYKHIIDLEKILEKNPKLATAIGNDYIISPDVIIVRGLLSDEEINKPFSVVTNEESLNAALREINGGKPILHASISCKWTLRSDRAQNSRSEALNLIRNRKGQLPHIMVITGEPLPSRIASLAMGTGDIDCVYHFALYELIKALKDLKRGDAFDMLDIMMKGNRLKDISDLPLDLSQ